MLFLVDSKLLKSILLTEISLVAFSWSCMSIRSASVTDSILNVYVDVYLTPLRWLRNKMAAPTLHFIHSFIHSISIVPLQVHYHSEALPTQHGYCVGV